MKKKQIKKVFKEYCLACQNKLIEESYKNGCYNSLKWRLKIDTAKHLYYKLFDELLED